MKDLHKKTTLLFTLLLFCTVFTNAQDVIIKNDSTKIQSKVIEITETVIKYKKWENQDGPLYNIALNEVNMIIYANGQMEIIKPSLAADSVESGAAVQANQTAKKDDKTNIEYMPRVTYKSQKVRYKPNRINIGLQSPLSFGADKEIGVVRNIFNLGFGTNIYSTPENDLLPYSFLFSLYGSLYAPVNRLLKNYEKQNKGLFVFAHAGYGLTMIEEYDIDQNPQLITSGGFVWRMGMDYYFVKGFGITVSAFEFKTYYAGIVYSFN